MCGSAVHYTESVLVMLLTREEHPTTRAGEMLGLLSRTHAVYATKSVVQDRYLDEARHCRRNDLRREHGPWRDLHVVAEFEISHETKGL